MPFPKATEMAHELVAGRVRKRGCAIDATAGNGHDTLFLAEQVGPAGKIFAFDTQQAAIDATRARLDEAGQLAQVTLKRVAHESLADALPNRHHGKVHAVMFNLGYLPGGDKTITTRWDTTLAALRAALTIVATTGIVTVTAYPGHPAGGEEANAVVGFGRLLDPQEFRACHYQFLNTARNPPFLVAIERVA